MSKCLTFVVLTVALALGAIITSGQKSPMTKEKAAERCNAHVAKMADGDAKTAKKAHCDAFLKMTDEEFASAMEHRRASHRNRTFTKEQAKSWCDKMVAKMAEGDDKKAKQAECDKIPAMTDEEFKTKMMAHRRHKITKEEAKAWCDKKVAKMAEGDDKKAKQAECDKIPAMTDDDFQKAMAAKRAAWRARMHHADNNATMSSSPAP